MTNLHRDILSTQKALAWQVTRASNSRDRTARVFGSGRHLLPVDRVAPDGRIDSPPRLHDTPDERDILLFDFTILELPRKLLVGVIVLRDHHDT